MNNPSFRAYVVEEAGAGTYSGKVTSRHVSDLPDHDTLVRVHYSSLNYKDALSANGAEGITRHYPHTPGIDAAGIVKQSSGTRFRKGDKVIVTSYDLGADTPGGFGEYISVPDKWVVRLPDNLTLRESMVLGTAGFTAAIGLYKLEQNGTGPDDGEILVTGATGGVGTLAVALLARGGYRVVAATGKREKEEYLLDLGAHRIIGRDEVIDRSGKPMLHGKWAGVIDTVGGVMLDTAIRQTLHDGTVCCCGNILGHELNTSIYPFILRGVSLMGIDSGNCLMPLRKEIWRRLASSWKPDNLESLATEIQLEDLDREIDRMLDGNQTGRVLIKLVE